MNNFLKMLYKKDSFTENGALSNSTTGSACLDYFSKAGTFRSRALEAVMADVSRMWAESPDDTMKIIFYNRMVTRKQKGFVTSEKVQKGQGNRDEFRKSLIWLARYQPDSLYKNLWMIPLIGTWKDLWHSDLLAELDRQEVYNLILRGIYCEYNADLLAKYLPRIRSKSNVRNKRHLDLNAFAMGLCRYLNWSPVQYRKFKSSGQAHTFQQQISKGLYSDIEFHKVPGKALHQMVNDRKSDGTSFMQRHKIESRYLTWIESQPVAKYTGYAYELMKAVSHQMSRAQKLTVDRQFDGLIKLAQSDGRLTENVWCALDTSGSMTARVANTTAYDVCISLGIYFSTLMTGAFKDHVIMFDNVSSVLRLSGSFSDKVMQLRQAETAWGSTNFQSVIDTIVKMRLTKPDIPIEDYPSTLMVVSDMQFNPTGSMSTNYEEAMRKLRKVGLPEMRIVWWWVTGRAPDFPSTMEDKGTILIGGFDGAIISMLLGTESQKKTSHTVHRTPLEMMQMALNQEVLNRIEI